MKKTTWALLLSVGFLASCNKLDGLKDSLEIMVDMPEPSAYVHVDFINVATGANITDKNIRVELSGEGAAKLYSILGERKNIHTGVMGMLDIALDPRLKEQGANLAGLEFDVKATADGYLPQIQRVKLSDVLGKTHSIQIPMLQLASLPDDVERVDRAGFAQTAADGSTLAAVSVQLDGGASGLNVEKGTVMKDASGQPVTGQVAADILYVGSRGQSDTKAFEAAHHIQTVSAGGARATRSVLPAGVLKVSLKAGNRTVKTFEGGGVTIRTALHAGMKHPLTRQPLAAGDQLELWSKEDDSNVWTFEKTATVRGTAGDLYLEESIHHLSTYLAGATTDECSVKVESHIPSVMTNSMSTFGIIVPPLASTLSSFLNASQVSFSLYGETGAAVPLALLSSTAPARSIYAAGIGASGASAGLTIGAITVPVASVSGAVVAAAVASAVAQKSTSTWSGPSPQDNSKPDEYTFSGSCGETAKLTYTLTQEVISYDVAIDMEVRTTGSSSVVIRPNLPFYIREKGAAKWNMDAVSQGTLLVTVLAGKEYELMGILGERKGGGMLIVEEAPNNKLKVLLSSDITLDDLPGGNVREFVVDRPAAGGAASVSMSLVVKDEIARKLGL